MAVLFLNIWFPEKMLTKLTSKFPSAFINHANSKSDFIILFELRVRRSGKFWSTVTMETFDLQEEERVLPVLATAHCHRESPASPGQEVGCLVHSPPSRPPPAL